MYIGVHAQFLNPVVQLQEGQGRLVCVVLTAAELARSVTLSLHLNTNEGRGS